MDASALAAIAFKEPAGAVVSERLSGRELVAPSLLPYEMANVTLMKWRRGHDESALSRQLIQALSTRITLYSVEGPAAWSLAVQTGLTAYDASYLWLADAIGCPLVTLDERLAKAASVLGH